MDGQRTWRVTIAATILNHRPDAGETVPRVWHVNSPQEQNHVGET